MHANLSLSGLACMIALMFFNPGPAKAQPARLRLTNRLPVIWSKSTIAIGAATATGVMDTVTVIGRTATTDARMGTATGPTIHMDTAIRTGVRALAFGSASKASAGSVRHGRKPL